MVETLEKLVLLTVPFLVLLDLLKSVWHLPLKKPCLQTLFRRAKTDELTRLAKTLPWEDPVARALDFEVHRRKMAGKMTSFSFGLCFFLFIHVPLFEFFGRGPGRPAAAPMLALAY